MHRRGGEGCAELGQGPEHHYPRADIQKSKFNFNGCFCGATCLRMAGDIIRAGDATAVVASSHYDWHQLDTERMIAQSLFWWSPGRASGGTLSRAVPS